MDVDDQVGGRVAALGVHGFAGGGHHHRRRILGGEGGGGAGGCFEREHPDRAGAGQVDAPPLEAGPDPAGVDQRGRQDGPGPFGRSGGGLGPQQAGVAGAGRAEGDQIAPLAALGVGDLDPVARFEGQDGSPSPGDPISLGARVKQPKAGLQQPGPRRGDGLSRYHHRGAGGGRWS